LSLVFVAGSRVASRPGLARRERECQAEHMKKLFLMLLLLGTIAGVAMVVKRRSGSSD
jgi:hypothetical protein